MRERLTLTAFAACMVASPAGFGQQGRDNAPADRCESTACFNQLQIRDVEVIGKTAMIVFVGGQGCPFLVELNGTFCDLTFLPPQSLVFRPSRFAGARTTPIVGGRGTAPDGGGPIERTRVCASDLDMGIAANSFTSAVGDEDTGNTGLSCQIQTVRSLTDDERIQIYVDNEMSAPPPPFGTGRVESPENPQEPAAGPVEEEEEGRRRRRRDRDQEDEG